MPRPGMSDGRIFTNYLPNCQINNTISSQNGFLNNVDYKQFIQQNSEEVMKVFTSSTKKDSILPCSNVKL